MEKFRDGTPLNEVNNAVDSGPLLITPITVDASDAIRWGLSSTGTIWCLFVANLIVYYVDNKSPKWSLSLTVHIYMLITDSCRGLCSNLLSTDSCCLVKYTRRAAC